jgi:hypothetical protein
MQSQADATTMWTAAAETGLLCYKRWFCWVSFCSFHAVSAAVSNIALPEKEGTACKIITRKRCDKTKKKIGGKPNEKNRSTDSGPGHDHGTGGLRRR